jgi:hypothetical protein
MKRTALAIAAALLLAAPLSALADNPPPSSITSTTSSNPTAANPEAFAGSVVSASSTSLTVNVIWSRKGSASGTETVGIDASTQIVYGKHQTSIDPGDLVRVIAANGTAKRIHVNCNCHFAAGTLDAISTSKLRVQVERTGPYDTVLKGNNVTFDIGSATLPNLSVGDKVAVVFSADGFFKDPSFDWQNATFTVLHLRVVHDKGESSTNQSP